MWVPSLYILCSLWASSWAIIPLQVHLSTQGDPTAMAVTWITFHPYANAKTVSLVQFGKDANHLDRINTTSRVTKWVDGGAAKMVRYTHRVRMTNLEPGVKYYYSVGSAEGMSKVFSYTSFNKDWKHIKFAVFGDFGLQRDFSLKQLSTEAQQGIYDVIFHIGDLAYDLDYNEGTVGDKFMDAIQNITAYVPYMVLAGNHEYSQDFLHFKHRFTTPITNKPERDNQYWSFNLGPVHFVGLSSEYYCYKMYTEANHMFDWLNEDLKANTKPWIITMMHRPMYCSASCDSSENLVTRVGATNLPALEPVLGKYGADFMFAGHKHYYERLFPVYKSTTFSSSDKQKMHNAKATIHTVSGSAGCHTHIAEEGIKAKPFSAHISDRYGYSVVEVLSDTAVNTWFMDEYGTTHDFFSLTKDAGYRPIARF